MQSFLLADGPALLQQAVPLPGSWPRVRSRPVQGKLPVGAGSMPVGANLVARSLAISNICGPAAVQAHHHRRAPGGQAVPQLPPQVRRPRVQALVCWMLSRTQCRCTCQCTAGWPHMPDVVCLQMPLLAALRLMQLARAPLPPSLGPQAGPEEAGADGAERHPGLGRLPAAARRQGRVHREALLAVQDVPAVRCIAVVHVLRLAPPIRPSWLFSSHGQCPLLSLSPPAPRASTAAS